MVHANPTTTAATDAALIAATTRRAVCVGVATAVDLPKGERPDLNHLLGALHVLADDIEDPVHLFATELARASAAFDARVDGYGPGERPLEQDAQQLWALAAADGMVEALGVYLEGASVDGFLVEAFSRIDASFGEPVAMPTWRTELRAAFCDPDDTPDVHALLGDGMAGLWEMLLCLELARAGSFDEVLGALTKAGPGVTIAEIGPALASWYSLPSLLTDVAASALDADAVAPEVALSAAFAYFDESVAAS